MVIVLLKYLHLFKTLLSTVTTRVTRSVCNCLTPANFLVLSLISPNFIFSETKFMYFVCYYTCIFLQYLLVFLGL